MTEAEALDEAAKAAGWRDWKTLQLIARPDKQDDIRRHARTLMENAALKAENEALKALRDDDGELLTIAWMDGAHRSNTAQREHIAALKAEVERLREALKNIINNCGQCGGYGTYPEEETVTGKVLWSDCSSPQCKEARTALERNDHGDR